MALVWPRAIPLRDQQDHSRPPGAGISTSCPSPTPFGLGLGPTNPLRSDRAAEALGMRQWGFSPHHTLLIPTFALDDGPHRLTLMFRPVVDAPLPPATRPRSVTDPTLRGVDLTPRHYRRNGPRPVSYYALFQGWLLLSQPPGCLGTVTSFATESPLGALSGGSGLLPF
jgi:hypothetical protein